VPPDGRVLRRGNFPGDTRYGAHIPPRRGGHDIVRLALAAAGTPLSTHSIGGALDDLVLGMAVDDQGRVFTSYVAKLTEPGDSMDLVVSKLGR
jgi:hypothetical protein